MKRAESHWGALFPVVAAIVIGAAAALAATVTPRAAKLYAAYVPWVGLALSLAAFGVGHLSYPRIHNLKVYLAGWLTGLTGTAFFLWHLLPTGHTRFPGDGFLPVVYLLIFANLFALPLVPSFATYQATKFITWLVGGVELAGLVAAALLPQLGSLTTIYGYGWAGGVAALAAVALSWRYVQSEFHLGGVLAGYALFFGAALWFHEGGQHFWRVAEPLTVCLGLAFFEAGILFHWMVRMEHRIAYDPLLQIYNRDYCSRILSEQSRLNVAPPFTVAMVDIDHFKRVNDTYGHQAGDVVLYHVAQTVSRAVVPAGTLCRYGGEELAVFFPQTAAHEARELMERVRRDVQRTRIVAGRKHIGVTVSCGVSTRSEAGQSLLSVLAAADKALYRAKEGGRNQVRAATAPAAAKKR